MGEPLKEQFVFEDVLFKLRLRNLSAGVSLFIALFLSFGLRAEEERNIPGMLIQKNQAISKEIDKAAEKIDIYLAGRRVTKEKNETSVKIENSFYYGESGRHTTGTHFGVNLKLPNLQKKWQLKFTSYDEEEENRSIDRRQFRTRPPDENYGASLVFFKKLGNIDTSFQPRLQLKDPLDMSYVLTFDSDADMKSFRVDPKLQFFARPDKGVGVFGSVDVNFALTPWWELTFSNDADYEDAKNTFTSNSGVSLGQKVSDNASVAYSFASTFNNRETYHLMQYGLAVDWEHMPVKDVLSYSIGPLWSFNKEDHFHGVIGTRARLDFLF
jgi:hypothetical protein